MELRDLYPSSPQGVRAVQPAGAYRLRVVLVLFSLVTFMLLYVGLVAGTAYALYSVVTSGQGGEALFWGSALALLLVFLVKNVFRSSRTNEGGRIELTEADQPRLFAFLRRLCAEAGCRFPRAVYLTHEVNAAVFYPRSALSLFVPRRKNLLIGLGLVNALNVSELKAVLAHEFGHFAQSSMKLGQYVYVANEVVRDIVFTRDSWDALLAKWRSINLRLSFPAWALTGVLWAVRGVLKQLFKLVNFANLSLSRQMEFDADLHAVALTGSDALVSALWKCERAGITSNGAWQTLSTLLGYGKYTSDVFHHQRRHEKRLSEALAREEKPTPFVLSLRSAYRPGPAPHFHEADDHAPSMWSTHPSNRERELNVKREYVACEPLEISAWRLFDRRKELKRQVTLLGYRQLFDRQLDASACLPPEEIEALLAAEQDELRQAAHYRGFYENRMVDPGALDALAAEVDALPPERLAELRAGAAAWSGAALGAFMAELAATASADEVKKLRERLPAADAAIFRHFYAASARSREARAELLARYRFLLAMQKHIAKLNGAEALFGRVVERLRQAQQLGPEAFREVQRGLLAVHERLEAVLVASTEQHLPKLGQLEAGQRVRDFILDEPLGERVHGDRIAGDDISRLGRVLGKMLSRLRRLHFKNLGSLLRLQEQLDPALYVDPASGNPTSEPVRSDRDDDEQDDEIA